MKPNSKSLLIELERELDHIHIEHTAPISYCEHALQLLHTRIEKLENLAGHSFATKEEETDFLNSIKPPFASRLIYYHEVFNIEHHKPCGSEKIMRNYYKSALEKLKTSSDGNLDFYNYCRMKNACPDSKYFPSDDHDTRLVPDASHGKTGQQFLTPDDFKAAKIPASDLIKLYLEYELAKLDARSITGQIPGDNLLDKMNEGNTS